MVSQDGLENNFLHTVKSVLKKFKNCFKKFLTIHCFFLPALHIPSKTLPYLKKKEREQAQTGIFKVFYNLYLFTPPMVMHRL